MEDKIFSGEELIKTTQSMAEVKAAMSQKIRLRYIMRAMTAGICVGFFYLIYFAVTSKFGEITFGDSSLYNLGFFLSSWIFGGALILIYFTKSELLTSNMMVTSIGVYRKKITPKRALSIMGYTFLGNALGGLVVALLLAGTTMISEPMFDVMIHAVEKKTSYFLDAHYIDLFVRAIWCNFFINISMIVIYSGEVKNEVGKMVIMAIGVFVFMFLGLEHSVANTVLFLIAAFQGADVSIVGAVGNVAVALLGNFVGGGLMIGVYHAYINDRDSFNKKKLNANK